MTSMGSPTATLDLLIPYLNFGLIVVLLIMTVRKIGFVPKWTLDDQQVEHERVVKTMEEAHEQVLIELRARLGASEADRLELKEANVALQRYQRDELGPALIDSSRIIARYVDALQRRGGAL